jgi:hypothetical protein
MLTVWGEERGRFCDGLSRRSFLKVGALTVGGLTLADVLRLKAQGAVDAGASGKAIIMVYLNGGPSHIDLYDMKPEAPVEYRGEFKPIKTNVSGMHLCELLPLQAKIADKLAIIRNMKFLQQGHTPPELYSGFLDGKRPSIGSVVSKLRTTPASAPPCRPTSTWAMAITSAAPVFWASLTRRISPARGPAVWGWRRA